MWEANSTLLGFGISTVKQSMKSSVELLSITVFLFLSSSRYWVLLPFVVCSFGWMLLLLLCCRYCRAVCCISVVIIAICRRSFLFTLIGVVWSVLFNLFFTTVLCGYDSTRLSHLLALSLDKYIHAEYHLFTFHYSQYEKSIHSHHLQ